MRFKDWLEAMTSTGDISHFSLPIGMIRRNPPATRQQDPKRPAIPLIINSIVNKKKKGEQPQVKDA